MEDVNLIIRYKEVGCNSRDDYLKRLSQSRCVDPSIVYSLATLYGPEEDFDDLVTAVEDMECW